MPWNRIPLALLTACACAFAGPAAQAMELFEKFKLRPLEQLTPVTGPTDTVGGMPVLPGDWRFLGGDSQMAIGPTAISIGQVGLGLLQDVELIALLQTVTNLQASPDAAGWSGPKLCDDAAILAQELKASGRDQSCLAIFPSWLPLNGKPQAVVMLVLDHSAPGGRLHRISLLLSAKALGFDNTTRADWTKQSVAADPAKTALIERLMRWGRLMQADEAPLFARKSGIEPWATTPNVRTLFPQ